MRRRVRSILALLPVAALAAATVVAPPSAAALSCGPCPAVAAEQANLRAAPSLDAEILRVIPAGAELRWDHEPAAVDGYVPVIFDGTEGWAHDDLLLLYPASATTLAAVNQRADPGLGAPVVGVLPAGASLILLTGPVPADGYAWYVAAYQDSSGNDGAARSGWVAGDFMDLDLR